MDPARSVEHREDRNVTAGLAFVWTGLRNPRIETEPATIPDTNREPTEPTFHDRYEPSTAVEGEPTRSETTTIHEHQDLIDQDAPTKIDRLHNRRPSRHTHLQPVARDRAPGVLC